MYYRYVLTHCETCGSVLKDRRTHLKYLVPHSKTGAQPPLYRNANVPRKRAGDCPIARLWQLWVSNSTLFLREPPIEVYHKIMSETVPTQKEEEKEEEKEECRRTVFSLLVAKTVMDIEA